MTPDKQRIQYYLKAFDFKNLFVEELGWDYLKEPPLTLSCKEQTYTLRPLVEKRGVKVYLCDPDGQDCIPDDTRMRLVDREVVKYAYEHIVIYIDAARENQVWQWVKREQGKPLAPRVNKLLKGQSADLLAQKLMNIAFEFAEEESLTTHAVAGRVRQAFDVERVTKKFYDRFKTEHSRFLEFVQGIASKGDREWYTSLMLNRLMFVYFIQRQGFLDTTSEDALDGDTQYLRHRLEKMQTEHSKDRFYSFYRYFLLKLFHDGLSRREHSAELEKLLGKIPYLNGGIFDVHQLERDYTDIQIPDEAFERIFDFFDEYDWHLDDRPSKSGNEINPDVLGYIFEKYINQKQMGAYYTKEDITEYISKNTIIPYLFEAAEQKCLIAFEANGPVWSLLRENPDRYIYAAIKKGTDLPLPPEIEVGICDVSKRTEWNKPATSEYALPTEIWREVVARRARCQEIRTRLAAGEVTSINDFITYNLDIRQFAQDVLTYCEGSELLLAFYESIERVTVLDPSCGSGAFLFAALNILELLYEACLDRMKIMVEERDRLEALLEPHRRKKFPRIERFRTVLQQVEKHHSRDYFILKSIIINNLYGVDIMEEATEICKLRLFLKLAAQVKKLKDIEPLPDIDFNIRAGNTLVGFASYDEVKESISRKEQGKGTRRGEVAFQNKMDFDDTMGRIEQRAKEVERGFRDFRAMQTELELTHWDLAESKQQLRAKLDALNAELDEYLAAEYGVDRRSFSKKEEYDEQFKQWRQSHQPFHWFVQFYGIMSKGGFDVIMGNPPYVEWSKITTYNLLPGLYATRSCGNLYTVICERSYKLLQGYGLFGMIVPVSCVATDRMEPLRRIWKTEHMETYISHYSGDAHPSVLFQGVKFRLSVVLQHKGKSSTTYSTSFQRWFPKGRESLFPLVTYVRVEQDFMRLGLIPKIGAWEHTSILRKLCSNKQNVQASISAVASHYVYCHRIVAHFVKAFDFIPFFHNARDGEKKSEDYKVFSTDSQRKCDVLTALLNSNLFYCWFVSYSDVYHCGREIILDFPCDIAALSEALGEELHEVKNRLMESLRNNSVRRVIPYKATGLVEYDEFYPRQSKPIIDEIDRVLAKHYGFTDEELDFIINYDIKYRMRRDNNEDDEE
jgi:hypothetical protein